MAPDRQPRDPRSTNPGPAPTEPHRSNVPGELDHISGEVEEFEADLIAGAEGAPDETTPDAELEREALAQMGDLDDDGDVDAQDAAVAAGRDVAPRKRQRERPVPGASTRGGGGPRFLQFLRASWAELQRVQWPDRRQVGQATGVVIGFVIIAGAYLGIADWVAQKIVDIII